MPKPSQVARMLEQLVPLKIPFYLSGPVGAGKSQVVKQVCDKLGIQMTDVRLSQMDPTDIKGFPSPDPAKNLMRWLPADFLPTKGKGLLFLDELSSAPQSVQAAAYQLVLDRKVGSYKLPDGWSVGAAGNRASDRSIVHQMPAALANRFVHISYEIDLEDWVAHARAVGIDSDLISFLRFKSKLLHSFDPNENPAAFPSPRAWFTVNTIMSAKMDPRDEYALVTGTVGTGAATEHAAYMRVIKDLPTVEEIKIAPDKAVVPTEPSQLYALTTSLGMAVDKRSFPRFLQYVERMAVEWQAIFIRDCLAVNNALKFEKAFLDWSMKNGDVIL